MKRVLGLALLVALAGCETARAPWDEANTWVVQLEYNAKVPEMGDRIVIDVLDSQGALACGDCSREISPSGFGESFGVARTDNPVRVRVRMYRSIRGGGVGSGVNLIDVTARLPERETWIAAHRVTFGVPFGCFGRAPKIAEGISCQQRGDEIVDGPEPVLSTEVPPPLVSGSTCTKDVPKGMACVGFGAFLLGDERNPGLASDLPARPEIAARIGQDRALMLDKNEMDVGTVRRLLREGKVIARAEPSRALLLRGKVESSPEEMCLLGEPTDDSRDDFPMNCIGRDLASDVCQALGKRLPSEVEWEFAAGNGASETPYPWSEYDFFLGFDFQDTICDTAIVARGRSLVPGEADACNPKSRVRPGPQQGGNPSDKSRVGIYNLAGNVAEWVADELAFYDEPCREHLSSAPCTVASPKLEGRWAPYRGGSWGRPVQSTIASSRFVQKDGAPSPYIGFRCAITENELP